MLKHCSIQLAFMECLFSAHSQNLLIVFYCDTVCDQEQSLMKFVKDFEMDKLKKKMI